LNTEWECIRIVLVIVLKIIVPG